MPVSFIRIKTGAYRTTDVSNQVFQLVEQYKLTAKGGYVTVKNSGRFPGMPEDIRVKVEGMSDYEFVSETEFVEAVTLQLLKPKHWKPHKKPMKLLLNVFVSVLKSQMK